MAIVRNYVVTQERQITVSATRPAEAVSLTEELLGSAPEAKINKNTGYPLSPVKIVSVSAREEY